MDNKLSFTAVCHSADGISHINRGMACQDVSLITKVSDDCFISIVCDGCGSSPLGREAAEITAEATVEFCRSMDVFADCSISDFKKAFLDHMDSAYEHSGLEFELLASTAIIVAVSHDSYCVIHVGDGDILSYNNRLMTTLFSKGYNEGNKKNHTIFCNMYHEAMSTMQVYRGSFDDNLSGFVLLSDGASSLIDNQSILSRLIATTIVAPGKGKIECENIANELVLNKTNDDVSISVIGINNTKIFELALLRINSCYVEHSVLPRGNSAFPLLMALRDRDASMKELYELTHERQLLKIVVPLIRNYIIHYDENGILSLKKEA